ncbi:Sedlin [Aspergillus heteromorphus CBS 117.55]|uniref:Sedlin n=1 Tax=Aspergillus heteromorphus CBS 117.55 TaxID=1448321 RepID=A0A317UN81_9EURO|nr:Sedlin [Aspergillus heteromorphus CBS 117.55]PWY63161.1 Sedlin [Aspergillus heteromorphus CBS 117.55]
MGGAKIACIGVIGKADNPLHVSLFPPYLNSAVEFSFLLNSCLDVFEIRRKHTSVDQDLGLLHAVDERLAAYGWLTTTGVKLLVIIDCVGQPMTDGEPRTNTAAGIRESDLKSVFRGLQSAYVQLLQNPFYNPDEHVGVSNTTSPYNSQITDQKFVTEVKRIGVSWSPGIPTY